MSPFYRVAFTPGGILLRLMALLLATAELFMLFLTIRQRRKPMAIAWTALLAACGFVLLYATLQCTYDVDSDVFRPALWMAYMPWAGLAAIEIGFGALVVICGIENAHHVHSYLCSTSIKHAIDTLPMALYVGTDKVCYLVNLRMQDCCRDVVGYVPHSADELWQRLQAVGRAAGDSLLVRRADETWLFESKEVTLSRKRYRQIDGHDVTEQYRITSELQAKHDKLTEVQRHMREVSYETEDLAVAKEYLDAKVRVHDELGHILLLGKYYLEHVDQSDEELLQAMVDCNERLLDAGTAGAPDVLDVAVRQAAAIGIRVQIEGDVPHQHATRALVTMAVRECASNAAKHAEATTLFLSIACEGTDVSVHLTNDGVPPMGPIIESGGLLSLRRTVEWCGGTMRVDSAPFGVWLTLSGDED